MTQLPQTTDLHRLPWPFPAGDETFRYSVNVEPAPRLTPTAAGSWGEHIVDLGGDYLEQMALRRAIVDADPGRLQVLPHTGPASWDMLMHLMTSMAGSYPEHMHLSRQGRGYLWRNDLLGLEQAFVLGDASTLPEHPLQYIGCQVPDDLLLVTERAGQLWFDAALVTSSADWSVKFDIGMSMDEIHRPVPGLTSSGLTGRAEQFMRKIPVGQVYRRVNWTLSATGNRRRDTSLETRPLWMHEAPVLIDNGDYREVQLRIELEHLVRLPMSGAITFNIRTYMASLADVATVPAWAGQLAAVVDELPQEIAEYKGIDGYRSEAMAWLRAASRRASAAA
ncbi:MAG TPA: DUF3445 domain-containing protein [Mycobacteriales bacterium]|jgi:hypothetical protein|nr:DUF3445 domain-containing protein [Mycobacteriales bacterium]